MKFQVNYLYGGSPLEKEETNTLPSMTEQNDSLTIYDLFRQYANGLLNPSVFHPSNDQEDPDDMDTDPMYDGDYDLVDAMDELREINERKERFLNELSKQKKGAPDKGKKDDKKPEQRSEAPADDT